MYQQKRAARSQFVPIRNLNYHVLTWGEPGSGKVPLVMAHGWMDVAASYQFVVDAFAGDHYVLAPDWRGYGLTESPATDSYWFQDYLADLDFLLDHFSPGSPVNLVGHSMGGNVVMQYAGARPERVRRLVSLEGFGAAAMEPSLAPQQHAKWMDQLKAFHRGEMGLKPYGTRDGVAQRLMKTNRRLSRDKADWLAGHWARPDAEGNWRILGDAAHKIAKAQLLRVDEVLETYKSITAPVLAVEASEDVLSTRGGKFTLAEFHERLRAVADCRVARVEDAGHMLHHDQPEQLARLIEDFLAGG